MCRSCFSRKNSEIGKRKRSMWIWTLDFEACVLLCPTRSSFYILFSLLPLAHYQLFQKTTKLNKFVQLVP
ncbi:hypothetical protein VIGAN_01047300 [Vigna angularis var. angularis]|uniref:Uncharacterized protein n=1 Tax=Vigna angularis var. angularis TaxID=157739 RepID=A0A0S3QXF2_PHAAN|nr:hypothetical protein VIGAN_01047300 [Vigna angularis var. angularis]